MKIDFSQPILNLDGSQMYNSPDVNSLAEVFQIFAGRKPDEAEFARAREYATTAKPWTLGGVCATALTVVNKQNSEEDGLKKALATHLALRIHMGGEVDISLDEAKMIKDKVGRLASPVMVCRAFDLIDPPKSGEKAALDV